MKIAACIKGTQVRLDGLQLLGGLARGDALKFLDASAGLDAELAAATRAVRNVVVLRLEVAGETREGGVIGACSERKA